MTHSILPTYISVEQAAVKYAVDLKMLRQAIEKGTIQAVKTPEGRVLVASEVVSIIAAWADPELAGQPIRAAEAAQKYDISDANLSRWAESGYIRVLERGPKLLILDEADVKVAVELFQRACRETGSHVKAGYVLKRMLTPK